MKLKRLIAYFLDMLIVTIIASAIFALCFNDNYRKFNKASDEYLNTIKNLVQEQKGNIDRAKLEEKTKKTNYEFIKAGTTQTIIILTVEIIYFIFVQYFSNGQTIGKKVMKLRIKQIGEDKLNAGLFVLREAILFVIPIKIIDLICLISTNMNTYLKINSLTSNLESLVMIVIIALIIFRADGRGLHELASKTEIVQEKREK